MTDGFTMNDNVPPIGQQSGPVSEPPPQLGSAPPQLGSAPPQLGSAPPLPPQTQQQALLGAVETHFLAVRSRAVANLNGYMLGQAGVAEQPDVVAEVIKLVETIDHSEGLLNTFKRITSQ